MNRAWSDTQHQGEIPPLWWIGYRELLRTLCDGYQQQHSLFVFLLYRSANPGTVKAQGEADLNTPCTLIPLFLIYVKRTVPRMVGLKLCDTTHHWLLPNQPGRTWNKQTVSWISSFSCFEYSHQFILCGTELQGMSGSPRGATCGLGNSYLPTTNLEIQSLAYCRHSHASTRSSGFIAGTWDLTKREKNLEI